MLLPSGRTIVEIVGDTEVSDYELISEFCGYILSRQGRPDHHFELVSQNLRLGRMMRQARTWLSHIRENQVYALLLEDSSKQGEDQLQDQPLVEMQISADVSEIIFQEPPMQDDEHEIEDIFVRPDTPPILSDIEMDADQAAEMVQLTQAMLESHRLAVGMGQEEPPSPIRPLSPMSDTPTVPPEFLLHGGYCMACLRRPAVVAAVHPGQGACLCACLVCAASPPQGCYFCNREVLAWTRVFAEPQGHEPAEPSFGLV